MVVVHDPNKTKSKQSKKRFNRRHQRKLAEIEKPKKYFKKVAKWKRGKKQEFDKIGRSEAGIQMEFCTKFNR
jgi:hypothetical protein